MTLAILGMIIGGIFGGLPGAAIGGAVGYAAGYIFRQSVMGGLNIVQSRLVESTFSIMGALCKADNVVTRDEINAVKRAFDMLNLDDEQREQAKAAFNKGKQPDFDLDAAVDNFRGISRGQAALAQLFMHMQILAVSADGRIHPAEHEMLVRIARRLGMNEAGVSQIEAMLRAAAAGPSSSSSYSRPGAPPPADRLADAYDALGVPADATPSEIKRAYRRLMSKNHPDKLAARGLPESMRAVAEERSREINSAYDLIKESRSDLK